MANLTPHFTLQEMTVTSTDIPNIPDHQAVTALTKLCEKVLEPLRMAFGKPVIVNSAFRSPKVNKAIGGASISQHVLGEAADIEIPGVDNVMIYEFIRDNLQFDQLIAEKLDTKDGRAGWIHVSYREGRLRGECLSYLGNNIYKPGLHFVR